MLKKIITITFLILITTVNNFSQWSQNPYENNPVCTVSGGQYSPKITSDSKGGAIIAWEDYRDGTSKIYIQRIDKNGIVKWTDNGLPLCSYNSGQSNPQLIDDGNGGAVMVWVDDRYGNFDLFAQRIDSLGNKLWNSNGVLVFDNDGNQTQPQIVKTSDNIYYVVCLDDRMGTQNLFVQKLDLQGNMIWGDNGKMGNHLRSLRNFKSIIDKNDNLVLVWEDFAFNIDGMIYSQILDSNGNFLWEFNQDDLLISSNNINVKAQHPDLIQLQNGNYMIAWQDNRSGDFDIYGQILLPNGANLLSNEGEYLEGGAGNDIMPEICLSGNQFYMIAWVNNNSTNSFIKARSFYSDPVTFIQYWSQTLIVAQQFNGGFNYLNFISDKAGGALLSFVTADAEYSDIWFAKISSYGDKRGGVICNANINQTQLSVCSDSSDGIIATWADLRSGDFDIYCSQVDANGVFGAGQHEIGLVADYRFNGDATDAAYGNNATIFNATLTSDRFGAANSAFEFNGVSSYLSAPSTFLLESPTYELTQTAWVYLYDWGINGNSFVPILMKSDSPDNSFQYRLALSPHTVITSVNNWLNTVWQTGFNMNMNDWYMVTSVIKLDTVSTYINNEYVGFMVLQGPIIPDNKPLEIGRDVPGTTEYFYGKLDDIKIFNRALTYQEVINLYNFGSTTEIETNRYSTSPEKFSLEQNYPNPFNPSTKISWQLPVSSHQTLKVYDVLGKEVATLVDEYRDSGKYEVEFDASKLSSGIYFYKLNAGSFSETKKMILIK
ncbi:LamG-like jellyroll fold domain-containing protein [Ignavibacterium sp.]|uniref:LamG-like jellyroll fold domain-containing protein n=1 Tax=Ignavibacterium sp. TaxID=2651167 RepID=UPI00220E83AC|nr:LamG-like jellyroll fold domain-containing protein [Ignavibacterium sp.]BDQ02636.1 MAG: hypothetical protein KatS3mg037_1211 [Ignavibacterium sp.]